MTVEGAAGISRRRLQSLGVKGKHRITLAFSWARTPLAPPSWCCDGGASEQQEITFQIFTMKAESDKCDPTMIHPAKLHFCEEQ